MTCLHVSVFIYLIVILTCYTFNIPLLTVESSNVRPPLPEGDEGALEFKFPNFAGTHFQGNATHIHRPMKQSWLQLKTEGKQLVSCI